MRHRSVIGVATVAALVGLLPMSPATAAGPIQLGRIQYDQPGTDLPADNTKLNREYVTIQNTGRSAVNLTAWTLRDESGRPDHVYTFRSVRLGSGRLLVVHSGRGTDGAADVYWGRVGRSGLAYIWNNIDLHSHGDTAFLRNAGGVEVDRCTWRTGTGITNCR
jgi:lamin tail-like protein